MEWMNYTLLESISPVMEEMDKFHDHAMMLLLLIFSFLSVIFFFMVGEKNVNLHFFHNEGVEMIWTLIPMFVLLVLALPSIKVLFMMEELINPLITVKIFGNQWFWSYEFNDFTRISYDSFMKYEFFRFLDVDKALILPYLSYIRLLVSSNDVIHSWTVPNMGLKIDANPGRLNSGWLYSFRSGYFYGQCSEICGINHSFMPIKIEFCNHLMFKNWLMKTN
uniref:Cytochrome c oxidase subunit 2 n=1 Tax=Liposcelis sculptilimacula TaxID=1899352 RepID=A0A191ZS71_9NEOP|nr:cytochrome c oxidase subunit II [Liposcelis keleri]ANJ70937.1 cytochrome c oxidase subunit II [Liposcelis sculptilimacula]